MTEPAARLDPATFREALSHLAGGVVIVTTRDEAGDPRGMTATAVCSVSLDPPLVMACMDRGAATHRAVEASGVFALNILPHSAERLARRFASRSTEKFRGVETVTEASGAPVLAGALSFCDCVVETSVPAGDHTIFIGRVLVAGTGASGAAPLVYSRGAYGSVAPAPGSGGGGER